MSRIARQLCDEIEAPLRKKDSQRYGNAGKFDNKPKRNILIEKQNVISKVVPVNRGVSRIKFKSDETILDKSFVDTAANTTLRGPLVSDNNCVTLVRSRINDKCSCKTPQNYYPSRRHAKEVQTYNHKLYSFSDKACLHCVETKTCGTQSFSGSKPQDNYSQCISQSESKQIDNSTIDYLREIDRSQIDYLRQIGKPHIDYITQLGIMQKDSLRQANIRQSISRQLKLRRLGLKQPDLRQPLDSTQHEVISSNRAPSNINNNNNYMGARRWSLSQNHANGPDF